jgi:hypothetical protein
LFILIFKLLNYSEDKINKLFLEKEKIKKWKKSFLIININYSNK